MLTEEHAHALEPVLNAMYSNDEGKRPPRFDLRLIQRYVLWRVFDLAGPQSASVISTATRSGTKGAKRRRPNGSARSISGSPTTKSRHWWPITFSTGNGSVRKSVTEPTMALGRNLFAISIHHAPYKPCLEAHLGRVTRQHGGVRSAMITGAIRTARRNGSCVTTTSRR